MLTANDIREVTFNKGMGGYRAPEVDAFIDQCAETVSALTSSNKDLERKLEILADKLEEYRKDEDSIRTALLSAQRMGDTVVREANKKAGLILEDAKIKAENMQELAKRSIREEEQEYERIRREVAAFKSHLISMYREHLALIDVLPEEDAGGQNPTPEEEETAPEEARRAEESSAEAAPAPENVPAQETPEETQADGRGAMEIPVLQDDGAAAVPAAPPEAGPADGPKEDKPPVSRFADLKFGEDYDISKDDDDGSSGFFKRRK